MYRLLLQTGQISSFASPVPRRASRVGIVVVADRDMMCVVSFRATQGSQMLPVNSFGPHLLSQLVLSHSLAWRADAGAWRTRWKCLRITPPLHAGAPQLPADQICPEIHGTRAPDFLIDETSITAHQPPHHRCRRPLSLLGAGLTALAIHPSIAHRPTRILLAFVGEAYLLPAHHACSATTRPRSRS